MSEQKSKPVFFTLSLSYILEQLQQTDDQIIYSQALLHHFFETPGQNYDGIISIIVDIMWLNYSIIKLLTPYIEDAEPQYNEKTNENEYIIDEGGMLTLQTLAMSRYTANKELNQFSYSIRLH